MAEIPRLNGIIGQLEQQQVAFIAGGPDGVEGGPFDGVLFEMEHGPYDIKALQDGLQYLLNPRLIAQRASVAPVVTPIVRIPPNAGETNWIAKQVLDIGVYGIVWPHIDTPEQAYSAVAAMRYPKREGHPKREPFGLRGDAPNRAVRYWGVTQQEYYERADVWPLDPHGELLCMIMIESVKGIKNLPKILEEVPGIGVAVVGEGDLSQELGFPRQYDHPEVAAGVREILDVSKAHNVPCGFFHTTPDNVERLIADGYRWLISGPGRNYTVLNKGRAAAGRS
jgi:4-hydroxy-2-oxoheptanedioate aldolase